MPGLQTAATAAVVAATTGRAVPRGRAAAERALALLLLDLGLVLLVAAVLSVVAVAVLLLAGSRTVWLIWSWKQG
jgi:hypothetical protein